MWSDNESAIDLLGFDFLVDSLEILLTEPDLLPVTIGVIGDWGSGKSSLMNMAAERLRNHPEADQFIVVPFSPWRFEDHVQVKLALITAVVDAIDRHIGELEGDDGQIAAVKQKLRRVHRFLNRLGVAKAAATAGALAAGADPELASMAGGAAEVVTASDAEDTDEAEPEPEPEVFESVAQFHEAFAELVEGLGDEFQALVVFIDDMDRCATDTIIATFETIRLFLNAPKTAYVVGAHEAIITAALEGRYPARTDGDHAIGRHYLEKMLQMSVFIPPLSEPEALTYINFLYAERRLGRDSPEFAKLAARAGELREEAALDVAMNVGIARSVLGTAMPALLADDLATGDQIGPPLARGLRGNPRQIKRFLNSLQLRLRVAEKRGLTLDADKLAKLMVLETIRFDEFEKVFHWQIDQGGIPQQLIDAERHARGGASAPQATAQWALDPDIKPWLQMEPALANVALGPYFTFSRDRMRRVARASRLSAEDQRLFARLRSETEMVRVAAVKEALDRESSKLTELATVMLDLVETEPNGKGVRSLIEISAKSTPTAEALVARLRTIPGGRVRVPLVTSLKAQLTHHPGIAAVFDAWRPSASPSVKNGMALKKGSPDVSVGRVNG